MLVHVPRRPGQRVVVIGREGGALSPASIPDLFAWYDPSDLTTLFQDAAMAVPVTAADDPVGAMLDKSGNGRHVTAVATERPLYKTSGGLHWIETDDVNDVMASASFALTQPWDRVSAVRFLSVGGNDMIFGDLTGNAGQMGHLTGDLILYNGSVFAPFAYPGIGTDAVVYEKHSGAASQLSVDGGAASAGDSGATAADGLTIGSSAPAGNVVGCRYYGHVQFDRELTAGEISQLVTYLAAKQGRVL